MTNTYHPYDPLYASQWHLSSIGRLGVGGGNYLGLERVWADYTGAGVHVGVWDEGTQSAHWDLASNYDSSRHVTIGGVLNNGQPLTSDAGHGTSVGGLIAAANNNVGGVGVAFNADITGVRIFGGQDDINSYWSRYLQTLDHLGDFDVTNHSYGAFPSFYTYGDVAKFQAAAEHGRGGLGTINVKSAGNSNVDGNGEALDASRFTVTVAALDSVGQVTYYSTYGAHVLVSAPAGSVTTDLLGAGTGYDGLLNGDYTNAFGGTSAAGPVTAGVVTLMLDANSDLGWRDVQNILSYSAVGTGSLYTGVRTYENSTWKWNGADNWNGGGLHYSEDYGYGMVNAYNAVRMAEIWSIINPTEATSANERSIATGVITANRTIGDLSTLSYSFTVTQDISLEHVAMNVNLTHSYFTDLWISLTSPDGTVMTLYDGSTGSSGTSDSGLSYAFSLDGLIGERSSGVWTLKIQDVYAYDSGVLNSINFTGYGSTVTANDTYHYTDEVLAVLARPGQAARMTLADTDGGTDWIDSSAMYRNLYLNLHAGATSTLAGSAFMTIAAATAIENAIGGDGADLIICNDLNNIIYGMRGDDTLNGHGGDDTAGFFGARADYTITTINGVTIVTSIRGLGVDAMINFEHLKFDDMTIADPSGTDTTRPTLASTSPVDGASAVQPGANIVLTFGETVKAGSGSIVIHNGDGSVWSAIDVTDSSQVAFSGRAMTINPTANLASLHNYYVTVDGTAITDFSGNAFLGISDPAALNFTTSANIITGTNSANALIGTADIDYISGLGGNDALYGGAGDDFLDGGLGNDRLFGEDGADTLYGGVGNDAMFGGNGNDVYYVDSYMDWAVETPNAGADTVVTWLASHSLASNVENLIYVGLPAFTGVGNALNNTITGGNGADVLYGVGGNDVLTGGSSNDILYGQDGADTLNGGAGADAMSGGNGDDAYYVDSYVDSVVETPNAGVDTVMTGLASSVLGSNVENLTYTGSSAFTGVGNALNNTITGGNGADVLYGLGGNDVLTGGGGGDSLVGGVGDDFLDGGSGNDILHGQDGADTLNGGAGADVMFGGNGNDVYYVDSGTDSVVETSNAGVDTVMTGLASYSLGSNVENLTYTGSSAFTGVGNALNNTITGGNGADVLDGGGGLDHLFGGEGADLFVFASWTDAGAGATRDVIEDFQSGDHIDLSAIDANSSVTGDQAFTYVAAAAFSGAMGELRYADGVVSGDINGDQVADFQIQIARAPALTGSDFIL